MSARTLISVEDYLASSYEQIATLWMATLRSATWANSVLAGSVLRLDDRPRNQQAFTATAAAGLQEVKSGVLKTEKPALEVPLSKILR